jgi:hypothetical protein
MARMDEGGVALAAIRGFNRKMDSEKDASRDENDELKPQLDALKQDLPLHQFL